MRLGMYVPNHIDKMTDSSLSILTQEKGVYTLCLCLL